MKAIRLSAAILALGLVATPVAAQLAGQPAYAIPKGVGLGLNLDFGMQLDPSVTGGSNNLAARVTLGLPMIKFTAAFQPAVLDNETPGGESRVMAGAAIQLMPMPVSVRLQANVGYGMDSKDIALNPGVVIGLNVPSPAISVEPWIMPAFRYRRNDAAGTSTSGFGVSAGVNLGLPGGIGGHVGLDYDADAEVFTGGLGLHYTLSIPGLGMM